MACGRTGARRGRLSIGYLLGPLALWQRWLSKGHADTASRPKARDTLRRKSRDARSRHLGDQSPIRSTASGRCGARTHYRGNARRRDEPERDAFAYLKREARPGGLLRAVATSSRHGPPRQASDARPLYGTPPARRLTRIGVAPCGGADAAARRRRRGPGNSFQPREKPLDRRPRFPSASPRRGSIRKQLESPG